MLEDELSRAQHYRALAAQMQQSALEEKDAVRRNELLDLSRQYKRLAEKLVQQAGTKH
jgi:hypothetical protein